MSSQPLHHFVFLSLSLGADAADFAVSFASVTARGQLGPLGQQIPSMLRQVRLIRQPSSVSNSYCRTESLKSL